MANLEDMSDDEFLELQTPPSGGDEPVVEDEEEESEEEEVSDEIDDTAVEDDDSDDTSDDEEEKLESANPLSSSDDEADEAPEKVESEEPVKKEQDNETPKEKVETKQEVKTETKEPAADYESFYKEVMKPFKANGKEIKLNNVDEVVQLLQMGANYTKKLQALQPNLKMVKMLENNGLLDEAKINYLIDLDKKNPDAIRKLLSDSKIDPLDIDTSEESKYSPGNYAPSDEAMTFDNVLSEVISDDEGKKVIVMINDEWDTASKEAVFKEPQILKYIKQQKQNGLYDRISAEVERQRILGNLDSVPFINAYHKVGTEMQKQGLLNTSAPDPIKEKASTVVETRAAPRKTKTTNNDKAKAAAMVKTTTKKAAVQDFNPLAISDDEFEKNAHLAGRL